MILKNKLRGAGVNFKEMCIGVTRELKKKVSGAGVTCKKICSSVTKLGGGGTLTIFLLG